MGRLATCPSRIFTWIASMNSTGYTGSSGRFCQALLVTVAAMAPVTAALTPARADVVCDDWCQAAWAQQRANALPRTAFYDAPSPLRWAPAGTLIRQQPATDYTVPAGTGVTRLLYHSRTAGGRDVAASAVVLTPSGTSPHDGWPVVLDAHGTSGVARDCAPSLMRDLYHGDQMARFLTRGYAVVAPDYAGLGTDGAHALGYKTAAAGVLRTAGEADAVVVPRCLTSDPVPVRGLPLPLDIREEFAELVGADRVALGSAAGSGRGCGRGPSPICRHERTRRG